MSSSVAKVDQIYGTHVPLEELPEVATTLREDVIEMLVAAGSGHSAGPLGLADFFAAHYFHQRTHTPQDPQWDGRDRFVLSAGHLAPILYATLARSGYFPLQELTTLRKFPSRLQGHPHPQWHGGAPGIEFGCASLGQGVGVAVGIAYASRMDHKKHMTYCLGSDGELNEGSVWEALMFAGKEALSNLCYVIDRNNIQIDGHTEEVMPLEPLRDKLEAFGWYVKDVNGHAHREIVSALEEARAVFEKPMALILHTIPGKGVDFIEYKPEWHGKPPTKEEAEDALCQLRTVGGRIECLDA